MADHTAHTASREANAITFAAADAAGDTFSNTGKEHILLKNIGTASVTLTAVTTQQIDDQPVQDREVSIPAGETHLLGPWPQHIYNDPDGKVSLSFDTPEDIELAILRP